MQNIDIINSLSEKQDRISYADFDEGKFPWEIKQSEDTAYPTRNNKIYLF